MDNVGFNRAEFHQRSVVRVWLWQLVGRWLLDRGRMDDPICHVRLRCDAKTRPMTPIDPVWR